MYKKMCGFFAVLLTLACLLSGCGSGSTEKVEGLDQLGDIKAFTREADSGTRASFDDLTGISSEADSITEAGSTDELLKVVGDDKGAIGYLTATAVDKTVKTLTVNGKSWSDKKYPLTRKLYLVYKGTPSDLEREFITYATGKGQEIVKEDFEPIQSPTTFLSLKPSGSLKIGGSSSEAPVMEKLAEAYMKENPNAKVTVETTDSGTGINGALQGQYDLGMSSRQPKDYEKNLLTFEPVAKDSIAVVVEDTNPLNNITTDQLKEIYTAKMTKWSDFNDR